ncbi:MAG: type III pantothenate kinase [Gemmatimonadetes bacterium]|nr:type III pantothenate kinase [Gemmatimonadota bacterium]
MILAFDVGNTETMVGLFDADHLVSHWRFATATQRTGDELGLLIRGLMREAGADTGGVRAAVIASVVPPVTPMLVDACTRYLAATVYHVDSRTALPIRLDVEEPLTVGADRIANTLAAATLYRRDTLTVDLGTATTFDCITADGVFVGGVISPGLQTGAENLVRRTAKLPRVDLDRPERVIGRRTETALQSGIFHGAVEAIDGTVRRILAEWQRPDPLVVATGGLATLIGPHCVTVQRIEPFLTLYGLEIAYRHIAGVARAT